MRIAFLEMLVIAAVVAGCAATPGWQGKDVHLVDGFWLGTERNCRDLDDGRCRLIVAAALRLIGPEEQAHVVRAQLAELPTRFVTATGEVRTARLFRGTNEWAAVVLDRIDGARVVVQLQCGPGDAPTCAIDNLDDWRDGHAPPSYPPGTLFG